MVETIRDSLPCGPQVIYGSTIPLCDEQLYPQSILHIRCPVEINGNFTTVESHDFYMNKPDSNIPEHVNFGAGITRKIVLCPACGWSEENALLLASFFCTCHDYKCKFVLIKRIF